MEVFILKLLTFLVNLLKARKVDSKKNFNLFYLLKLHQICFYKFVQIAVHHGLNVRCLYICA